jgi:hypothetical protein
MAFLPGQFSDGIPIMNITSISHRPIRVGGSLAAALLVAGLQLSLVAQDFCQQSECKGFSAIPELPRRDLF